MKKLLDIMEEEVGHVKIDKPFLKSILDYRMKWITSKRERMDFLSSHLIGVIPFRFTDHDEDVIIREILDVNKEALHEKLLDIEEYRLEKRSRSNLYYLVLYYLVHKAYHSKLSTKDREELITNLINLIGYRMLSSIMARNFQYDLDEDIAVLVYEKMSMKFLLKEKGSWQAVIDHYVNEYLPKGIHHKRILHFKNKDVFNTKNDFITKLKSIVKMANKIVYAIIEDEEKRTTVSDYMSGEDGKEMLVDIEDHHTVYFKRVKEKIVDERLFIKQPIVNMVVNKMVRVKDKDLTLLLKYLVNSFDREPTKVYRLVEMIVKINTDYLYINKMYPPYGKDLDRLIRYIKGYWLSSSIKLETVKEVKQEFVKYAEKALDTKNPKYRITIANAAIIYVFVMSVLDI